MENYTQEAPKVNPAFTTTRLVNVKKGSFHVFIGKGSFFANPFFGEEGALAKFKAYLWKRYRTEPGFRVAVNQLDGKRLGCTCRLPELTPSCHGSIIIDLIDFVKSCRFSASRLPAPAKNLSPEAYVEAYEAREKRRQEIAALWSGQNRWATQQGELISHNERHRRIEEARDQIVLSFRSKLTAMRELGEISCAESLCDCANASCTHPSLNDRLSVLLSKFVDELDRINSQLSRWEPVPHTPVLRNARYELSNGVKRIVSEPFAKAEKSLRRKLARKVDSGWAEAVRNAPAPEQLVTPDGFTHAECLKTPKEVFARVRDEAEFFLIPAGRHHIIQVENFDNEALFQCCGEPFSAMQKVYAYIELGERRQIGYTFIRDNRASVGPIALDQFTPITEVIACPECLTPAQTPITFDKFEGEDMEMAERRDQSSPFVDTNPARRFTTDAYDHESMSEATKKLDQRIARRFVKGSFSVKTTDQLGQIPDFTDPAHEAMVEKFLASAASAS
jgi:hypothetical protein